MRKFILCCGITLYAFALNAQSMQHVDMLGETPLIIHTDINDSLFNLAFVHVHANELTALQTAKKFSLENKTSIIYLQHPAERNISFTLHDTVFEFDPNRMFTSAGRKNSVHPYSVTADNVVRQFAEDILLQLKPFTVVVAVHNNTPSSYSVKSYGKGGMYERNASKVSVSKKMDEDDFIFTTDENIFKQCKKEKLNVVLQDNKHCTDDGSLSVYYANKNVCYVNIEAEHEHMNQQMNLLKFIYGFITH